MNTDQLGMNEVQAAQYLGCPSFAVFKRLLAEGVIPEPAIKGHGVRLWSREQLDATLKVTRAARTESDRVRDQQAEARRRLYDNQNYSTRAGL